MANNVFKESWGGAAYGLLLKDIKDCRVLNNKFERNSIAIHIDGSDRIQIEKNVLIDNGWAIKIMANCQENEISDNDFINNSFQVATNSRHSRSAFSGNYWSSYQGYDLDRDGYGDVAYRPVSLYSLLVESNPPTLVLLRSLTIEALDLAERIIPTLTPETLLDSKPRMRPNL
jgi:nitrous oxidase accessory protein